MTDSQKGGERLGVRAAQGVLWTGAGQMVRQLIQVVGSIALARLLAPDDFGVMGMAMFFVGIGQMFANFGIGSAIIQARADDRIVLSSCFWLNMAVAGALALLNLVAAPAIAAFYQRQDLAPFVAVLSLNLLLAGLMVVPQALLYRDMRFADLARAQVLGSFGGAIAAIALAWYGVGVWSLVAQPLVGSAINLAFCLVGLGWRPHFEFCWTRTKPLASFSVALLGTNLVGYANRNVDSLLVGRFLGAGPLGLYSMAIQLMLYPLQQVSSVIVRVLFPTLVQIKDDPERLRGAYLKSIGAIAFITFPMMLGLFSIASDFVLVVFGEDWMPMVPVLKVLCWVGMMQSIGTTVGTIYLSMARPNLAFRVTLIGSPFLIGGMAAGIPWGILGVAIGFAAASFGLFYYVALRAFDLIQLSLSDFHSVLVRPLIAAAAMAVALYGFITILPDTTPIIRLTVSVLMGVALYAIISSLVNRRQVLELWNIVKGLRTNKVR
jgi:O-antigen/teichoic acid export membrane protein